MEVTAAETGVNATKTGLSAAGMEAAAAEIRPAPPQVCSQGRIRCLPYPGSGVCKRRYVLRSADRSLLGADRSLLGADRSFLGADRCYFSDNV